MYVLTAQSKDEAVKFVADRAPLFFKNVYRFGHTYVQIDGGTVKMIRKGELLKMLSENLEWVSEINGEFMDAMLKKTPFLPIIERISATAIYNGESIIESGYDPLTKTYVLPGSGDSDYFFYKEGERK